MKHLTALLALLFVWSGIAPAQEKYPGKPITMILALGPGTVQDLIARVVSEPLRQEVKTDVPFEYKSGPPASSAPISSPNLDLTDIPSAPSIPCIHERGSHYSKSSL